MATDEHIVKFAERVERLCKRLREHMDPGEDRNAVEDLENEAADLATKQVPITLSAVLSGVAAEL